MCRSRGKSDHAHAQTCLKVFGINNVFWAEFPLVSGICGCSGFRMIPLLIAGGAVLTTLVQPQLPELMNHTLSGSEVKASNVVCRNRWGTPMLPSGQGSYSLIASPDEALIAQSLIQPPNNPKGFNFPVYRPGAKGSPSVEQTKSAVITE